MQEYKPSGRWAWHGRSGVARTRASIAAASQHRRHSPYSHAANGLNCSQMQYDELRSGGSIRGVWRARTPNVVVSHEPDAIDSYFSAAIASLMTRARSSGGIRSDARLPRGRWRMRKSSTQESFVMSRLYLQRACCMVHDA